MFQYLLQHAESFAYPLNCCSDIQQLQNAAAACLKLQILFHIFLQTKDVHRVQKQIVCKMMDSLFDFRQVQDNFADFMKVPALNNDFSKVTNKQILSIALPITLVILIPQVNMFTNSIFLGRFDIKVVSDAGITGYSI